MVQKKSVNQVKLSKVWFKWDHPHGGAGPAKLQWDAGGCHLHGTIFGYCTEHVSHTGAY